MNLAQLIQAHRGDTSYARLAKKATEAGHSISGQMIHNLASKPLTSIPGVNTIRALSVALNVAPRRVLDAAAESVGLEPLDAPEETNAAQVEAIVSLLRDRPAPELEHLGRVVSDVVRLIDSTSGTNTPSGS